jgi:hypothetical protein
MNIENKDYIISNYLHKTCLYKESREIVMVKVLTLSISDWGLTFLLQMENEIQAIDEDELIYYSNPEQVNKTFEFSGAWEICSIEKHKIHVSYVNGTLNCSEKSMQYFLDREPDRYKLWRD